MKVFFPRNASCTLNVISTFFVLFQRLKLDVYLRIDRNFCSVHEEITSIRLYTPGNPLSGLRKCVYNLIEVISNGPNK